MNCVNPIWIFPNESRDGMEVPCGKCLSCRIQRRKEWSIRMMHEKEFWKDSIFITLTYDDIHLPEYDSLSKHELQKFFKRLRKNLDGQSIKYFACGEYGDLTQRPHYHAIIFGLSLRPDDKLLVIESWPYCDWNNQTILKESFAPADDDCIRYVAQYIDKKFSGELADEQYTQLNREPVFKLCSLGIGKKYVDKYHDKIVDKGYITLNGVKHTLPRYYLKRLDQLGNPGEKHTYETECDTVSKIIGLDHSRLEAYKILTPDDVIKIEEGIKSRRRQNDLNLKAKISLKTKKL